MCRLTIAIVVLLLDGLSRRHFKIYQILKTYCAITTDTNTALSSFNHSLKEWFTLKVDF